jgi:hypothetical protein
MVAQIVSRRRPSQAAMRRSLPVVNEAADLLDLVEIPIPCEVPWDGMPGDEQVRHCGQCKQNVYNVSMLTRAEANQLMRQRACLRIYRRPDNTVITSDCRARLRAARRKGLLIFAGTLLIVLWAQICAQFVGLMGLRRMLGGRGEYTMGEPMPVPGQIAPPPVEPPHELMGAPTAGMPVPPRHHHIGKVRRVPIEKPAEKMGKFQIMGQEG